MHQRSISRTLRSPVASTVFAVVFGLGGLAVAGAHMEQRGEAFGSAGSEVEVKGAKAGGRAQATDADGRAHGAEVSVFARRSGLEGWRKGAGVSALASSGRSQAGEHGPHAGQVPGDRAHPEPGDRADPGNQDEHAAARPVAPHAHADGPATPSGGSEGLPGTVNG